MLLEEIIINSASNAFKQEVLKINFTGTFPSLNNIMGYKLANGHWINLIAEGRLVNLAAGDGHPAEIMDMSFAIQALSAEYMAKNRDKVKVGVNFVPQEIDRNVAMRKLAAWGISIDSLSPEQERYINSWNV